MPQRVLDEREHRRGLVLGLTLAEILILLLFLLLLALGARLQQIQEETRAAQSDRDRYKADATKLKNLFETSKSKSPIEKLVNLNAALTENANLKKQLDEMRPLFAAVRKIKPDDPPAAILVLTRVAESLSPENVRSISQMSPGDQIKVTITRPKGTNGSGDGNATGEHDWPPIITLSEAKGYSFPSGSAEVSREFRRKLSTTVIEELLAIIQRYRVDVIEVVGHTDEQRFSVRQVRLLPPSDSPFLSSKPIPRVIGRTSNLDTSLIPFLNGADSRLLEPADNAGLGLARAATVARILARDARLDHVRILPLSGGQVIRVGDILSAGSPGDVKERRRIEIRARRSNKSAQPWQSHVSKETK